MHAPYKCPPFQTPHLMLQNKTLFSTASQQERTPWSRQPFCLHSSYCQCCFFLTFFAVVHRYFLPAATNQSIHWYIYVALLWPCTPHFRLVHSIFILHLIIRHMPSFILAFTKPSFLDGVLQFPPYTGTCSINLKFEHGCLSDHLHHTLDYINKHIGSFTLQIQCRNSLKCPY